MQLIQKNGGEMHIRDIKAAMEKTFPKDDYERERMKTDGQNAGTINLCSIPLVLTSRVLFRKTKEFGILHPKENKRWS